MRQRSEQKGKKDFFASLDSEPWDPIPTFASLDRARGPAPAFASPGWGPTGGGAGERSGGVTGVSQIGQR
jgi:hypothetical protein